MACRYFRCDWGHEHSDEPTTIFYEVDAQDGVPRIVEVFPDGSAKAQMLTDYIGREHLLCGRDSFVGMAFSDAIREMPLGVPDGDGTDCVTLNLIEQSEFDAAWARYRRD